MKLRRRRLLVVLIAAGILLACLVGAGIYGLVLPPARVPGISVAGTAPGATSAPTVGVPLKDLVHTDDPGTYADSVAKALFVWDTMSGFGPEGHLSVVSEDADPSSIETPGLVNDLGAYFPTEAQWQQLRQYKTAETLAIRRTYISAAWSQAIASDPSVVRAGTTAVTIDAVRHRTGIWYGTTASTSDPVSFTVFIACQPAFPRCHILRLSGLNTPLK